MTLGSLIYLFIWWAVIYTGFTLAILVFVHYNPYWKFPIYSLLLFLSFRLLLFLQTHLSDQFNIISVYLTFQIPPLFLWAAYWTLEWLSEWVNGDPIVAGINIRKSMDRKQ